MGIWLVVIWLRDETIEAALFRYRRFGRLSMRLVRVPEMASCANADEPVRGVHM